MTFQKKRRVRNYLLLPGGRFESASQEYDSGPWDLSVASPSLAFTTKALAFLVRFSTRLDLTVLGLPHCVLYLLHDVEEFGPGQALGHRCFGNRRSHRR
jgi:hypothetical protein